MKKINEKIKWIALFVCIAILAVFVMAAVTNGFTDFNPYGWFGEKQAATDNLPDETESETDNCGFEVHNTSLMKLSVSKAVSDTPVTTAVTNGVTLTATLLPATAVNKAVDWTVEFTEPSSTWAKGKTASDYVSVTPTSDGALTATVSAKKAFGAQVKITVTSRGNSEATAYCLVDYGQRLSSAATMTFSGNIFSTAGSITNNGVQTVEAIRALNWQVMFQVYSQKFSYTPEYVSDYTKANESATVTYSVKVSDSLYNALKAKGIAKASNDWVELEENAATGSIYESLCTVQLIPANGVSSEPITNVNTFNNAILAASGAYDFEIKISVKTTYETKDYIIQCLVNRDGAAFQASSISLNSTSIVL